MIGLRCTRHLKSLLSPCKDLTNVGGIFLRRGIRGSRYRDGVTSTKSSHEESETAYDMDSEKELLPKDRFAAQRVSVKKMLSRSATFEEIDPSINLAGADPFISGPYVQGTRVPQDVWQSMKGEQEEEIPKADPKSTTVITFPGDGTQFIGMCGDHTRLPKHIGVLYDIASGIMEMDLLDLCVNGPIEKLNQTRYSQPAILVASLAALEKLRDMDPYAVENCACTAGFGVGEIAALVFGGSLSFEDAVRLVKVRGEAMQLAGEMVKGGQSLVFYGADSKLGDALEYAKEWCRREYHIEYPVCSVANYLFPHCKIVGGNHQALEFLQLNYKDFKLRKVKRLPIAAAYHTELMRPAAEPIKAVLSKIHVLEPRIRVFSCHSGFRYYSSNHIKNNLMKQPYTGVRWEQILHALYARPQDASFPMSYECGPGRSLSPILKSVNRKAHVHHHVISL